MQKDPHFKSMVPFPTELHSRLLQTPRQMSRMRHNSIIFAGIAVLLILTQIWLFVEHDQKIKTNAIQEAYAYFNEPIAYL